MDPETNWSLDVQKSAPLDLLDYFADTKRKETRNNVTVNRLFFFFKKLGIRLLLYEYVLKPLSLKKEINVKW